MGKKHNILWTRNYILFFISNLLINTGTQFLIPTLPLYAMSVLAADQSQVGYHLGVYSFAALLIRPFSGYAYDNLGRKKMFQISIFFFVLLTFLYPFTLNFFMLMLLRLLHGIFFGMTSTGGGAIVGDIVTAERRAEGVGYYSLSNSLAMSIGPALGLAILGVNRYNYLFVSTGILVALALLFAGLISYPQHSWGKKKLDLTSFFEKRVISVSFIMLLVGVVLGGLMTYVIVYSQERGIKNSSLFYLLNTVGVVLTRFFADKVVEERGPSLILLPGFIIFAAGFITLAFSNGVFLFLMAAFLLGLGNGIILPTLQTMVINLVEPSSRGVANSTFFAALDIGIGGGSIVLGRLTGLITLQMMFLISGLFVTLPLSFYYLYVAKDYERKLAANKVGK
ncbi:MAG: MFS transporter [Firmicutes bacterium]|nr:MFS transporter [Bacillota bacterium]